MSTNHDLSPKLTEARTQLAKAQALVTELEAQLLENQTDSPAVRVSENPSYRILDNMLEGCQIIGFDWRYLYINTTAAHHGQRTKAELIGHTMMECYPGIDNTEMFSALQRCMQNRSVEQMENEFTYPDGTTGWFELSIEPVPEGLFILSLDITERKQADKTLKRYAQRMEILHEIDTGIINAQSIQEVIEAALKNIRQLILCQRVSVILFDWATGEELIFADDSNQPYLFGGEIRAPIPADWDAGFDIAQSKRINDLRLVQNPSPVYQWLIQAGLVSGMQTLLLDRGNSPLGFLGFNADTPDFFTSEHEEIAIQIADQLAIAIKQMQLSNALIQHVEGAEKMQSFLQTTLDAFPANTAVLNPDGTIIAVNLPWEQFAKENGAVSVEHFEGTNYLSICDNATGEKAEGAAQAAAGIRAVIEGKQDQFDLEYPCNSPDKQRWFILRVTAFVENIPRRVVVAHIDITERRQTENELQSLYRATESLFKADSLKVLGKQIVETVINQFTHADCGLMVIDHDQAQIVRLARAGSYHIQPDTPLHINGPGLVPLALRSGEIVYAADVTQNPNYVAGEGRTKSELVIPLKTANGIVGVFDLQSTVVNAFGDRDRRILMTYAERAAVAIENVQLYEKLNQYSEALEERVNERTNDLNQAKERVEAILNSSADGILVAYPDFTIQQTNTAFNTLFACEPDDYFNQPLTALLQIDDDPLPQTIQKGTIEGQIVNMEVRARRMDRSQFDAELRIGFTKKGGFVCSIRDITERKAQERQLQYQASLQQNVSDAVIVTDMNFRIQSWNQAAERIYGWRSDEAVDKHITEILQTQFASSSDKENSAKQLREQGWWQGEVVQANKDGSTCHILGSVTLIKDEYGVPFSVIAINHDISERKKTEAALQESESRYRLLAENVTDIIVKTDRDGIRTFITPSCYTLLGYTPEELLGKSRFGIMHPEDRSKSERIVKEAVNSFQTSFIISQRLQHKAGHYIWVEATNTIIRNPETGLTEEFIAVVRDISERKRAEAAAAAKAAEEREFQQYLKALHEVTIELTQIDDITLFYKNTVELGRKWLGFERLAMLLYEPEAGMAVGTFGTDSEGNITDERHARFAPDPNGILWRAAEGGEHFYYHEYTTLFTDQKPVGKGWNAAAVLWHGSQNLGWLVLDSFLSQKPASKPLLDILGLYALTVGTLLTQKQFQSALRESEARYRLLAENVTDVIAKLNAEGVRTFITPSCYAQTGYTQEELLGKPGSDIVHPDDLAMIQAARIEAVKSSKPSFSFTARAIHKAGHLVWIEATGSIVPDPDTGKPVEIIMVLRDVSERKRAEEAISIKVKEEREFQNSLKALHEITIELTQIDELDTFYKRTVELGRIRLGFERLAMFLYDEKSRMALGTYGTNAQGMVIDERHIKFEPNPSGILLRSFEQTERFCYNDHAPLYDDNKPIASGWNAATVLWNGSRNLGWLVADNLLHQTPASKPLLDILGLYGLTVGTLLAQKQVQLALRESEGRYRLLAENITDVVMRSSSAGEYLYVSPSSQTVLGYEPEELLGAFVPDYVHPDDIDTIGQAFSATIEQGLPDVLMVVRFRHKEGHYVWLETIGRAVHSEKTGQMEGFISSSRDISDRKRAEESLRESEEKFRLLLDAAPIATIITDATGNVTLVNIQAEELFGYKRHELVGKSIDILVPEYAHDTHAHNRSSYMASPRVRQMGLGLELFAKRQNKSSFPVEIELSYIQTKDGMMVMSFAVDITERKRAAAELERQRSFLRSVIDVSPNMIFVKDYQGRFVLANPMVAKMYNTTVDSLIGKTDADFNPSPEEVKQFLEADQHVITSGEPLFFEEPINGFSGEIRWVQTTKVPIVSIDGETKHVLGVATDITERKQSEAALQESEAKYRSLIETMRGGLVIFDLDRRITFINDRFCELLGYSREEYIGTRASDYVDPSNLPILASEISKRPQLESTTYELLFRHKDGSPVYLLVSGSPLLDKTGTYIGSFAVVTDISVQKQAEKTIQQAFEKEKELGELKTRFVSMASHEFRTPLATILALTETLSAYRHKLPEDQIELRFNKIKDQVGHLKDIMEDVLQLARMQARRVEFNPVKVDLDALCRSVLDEFQSRADVTHPIAYSYNQAPREVILDKKLMRQIISNLVSNAIKYSPETQPIKVDVDFTDDSLVLSVRDEGIGIPESDLPHLFEPFHRAANVGAISGTGLGLVITKESVELHGGTIQVKTAANAGTTFIVTLPLSIQEKN